MNREHIEERISKISSDITKTIATHTNLQEELAKVVAHHATLQGHLAEAKHWLSTALKIEQDDSPSD